MIREVGNNPSVATIERLVRRVLDDPRAVLAFRLPRGRGVVDRHGRQIVWDDAHHEPWQEFGRPGGDTAVAVVHDTDTADSPSLVNAVGAAAVLALENRRLHQELIDTIAALRASRKRIVTVAAAERRKIERDLHDSTQQELMAVRIQLELTRDRADVSPPLSRQLGRIGDDLNDALDRLRSLAHGIYPTLLAERGLGEALEDAARNALLPVVAEIEDVGRQPEEVETAVYYCCLEALQNASKHAGPKAVVTMHLWRDDGVLRFTVIDDGVGFPARTTVATSGLTNLSDRLGAVGGRITVRSAPGRGTAVDGMVVLGQ